jgi:hypothetical protein
MEDEVLSFYLYSVGPTMLTDLEQDGELDVIRTRPCEAQFRRLFPIIPLIAH